MKQFVIGKEESDLLYRFFFTNDKCFFVVLTRTVVLIRPLQLELDFKHLLVS